MNRRIRECARRHRAGRARAAGMTFMELMVVMALAAVLLTVAVPSFTAVINTSRQATLANTFLTSLHLARSEAIKRNTRVALCKSADGASCAANGRWDQGWIVFHDADNDAQVGVGEELIRIYEALPGTFALSGNNPVVSYVSYAPTGASRLTSGALQMGTVTLCRVAAGGEDARRIIISGTGRPRVEQANVASCPL
jgi:type IV fimbrial biogenesis protein FimT